MVADLRADACRPRPALDHGIGIRLWQRRAGQLPRAPAHRAKQRPLRVARQARAIEVGVQESFEGVVARLDNNPDWDEVTEVIKRSYRLTAPKRLVALLAAANHQTIDGSEQPS